MGQVVYADLLFLIDFSMDFLCLYITARLLHRGFSVLRGAVAAAFGGIYSVLIIFFSMNTWLGMLSDLGVCTMICLIAFGCRDKSLYEFCICASSYFGVSACLGGFMTAIYSLLNRLDLPFDEIGATDGISVWLFGFLAFISGIISMIGGRFFRRSSVTDIADVEITYGGKSISLKAFVDTGNMVSDPLSGRTVILVDKAVALKIMNEETVEFALKGRMGLLGSSVVKNIRLIPMKTASGDSILCAFVPEKITVTVQGKNKKPRRFDVNALFAPSELSMTSDKRAGGCHALISPELLV